MAKHAKKLHGIGAAFLGLMLLASGSFGQAQEQYAACLTPVTDAWKVTCLAAAGGPTVSAVTTLSQGESATGILESKPFPIPARLGFTLAGHSHQKKNFVHLVNADTREVYKSEAVPGADQARRYDWDLSAWAGKRGCLRLEDGDNASTYAWISVGEFQPAVASFKTAPDGKLLDWTAKGQPALKVMCDGIPFLKAEFFAPSKEGESTTLAMLGIEAETLYLLGGINSLDRANPDWGGGDSFQNLFVGDRAGTVTIRYRSGAVDPIPLIFGYTIWWREPYRLAAMPFAKSEPAKLLLDRALCVANGNRTDAEYNYLRVALRREPIESITFVDEAKKQGYPVIQGLTFTGLKEPRKLDASRMTLIEGCAIPDEQRQFLKTHTLVSSDPFPKERRQAVQALARSMSTDPSDISWKVLRETPPEVNEKNFPGPKVRFSGPPMAELMTRIYYENSNDILGRVDDEGMVHESHAYADYYRGFGGWEPNLGAFQDTSYTRLRALTLLSNMGFLDKSEAAIRFFDHWLMYFPKAYPEIQMGGKPVPGHSPVIANKPHFYFDVLSHVGWATKYTTRDFGNPENDGHGMLMLTRWRTWVKQGRTKEWVDAHWEALNEAAEYIPWCLDHPELSFSEHGLLYNESEGGLRSASFFCDYPCYLGLIAYADMAEVAGKADKAQRWREQAARLFKAMEAYYPTNDKQWGDIWNTSKIAAWPYGHTALTPILIGMDYFGYDAINHLSKDWAERTRRTYRRQRTTNQPDWCATAGIGYGQGYITEAALLLDQMADAAKLIDWMGRVSFSPRQPHPYRVPEGSTVATDGSVWRRWGDLGNLYQLAEVVYTIQLMLGIDDVNPAQLKLMPRLPETWTGMEVHEWPVRTRSLGKSVLTNLTLRLARADGNKRITLAVKSAQPVDACSVRLGPFPASCTAITCKVNGRVVKATLEMIGDSKWSWVNFCEGGQKHYQIDVRCK